MSKLTRKLMKVFGSAAGGSEIGKFGSLADGTPAYSTDPEIIQELAQYDSGWFSAILGGNSPAIEDMNALCYLYAYQLAYQMQTGIPEWNADTTYYIGSNVSDASGNIYTSWVDNNINNVVTNASYWRLKEVVLPSRCEMRLTLTSATPYPVVDQLAKTTVYLTPAMGNRVSLYTGGAWVNYAASEVSCAVPSNTNTPFDLFLHDNAGVLTLTAVAWTNGTTRATALTTQDGVYVQSGSTNKRYVGTGQTTSVSGQCEDSTRNRFIWNAQNRRRTYLEKNSSTGDYAYNLNSWREAENGGNRVDFVIGIPIEDIEADAIGFAQNTNDEPAAPAGIGVNSTSVASGYHGGGKCQTPSDRFQGTGSWKGYVAAGSNYITRMEKSSGVGTTTYAGTYSTMIQSGLQVTIWS